MAISFTIPGRVGGKGRPKFARRGKFVTAYTPEKTRNAEAMVRDMALQAMHDQLPLAGPVWLDIRVKLIPPASWPRKKRAGTLFVTGKPDMDNVLKLIGDALNGVCWADDAQIAAVFCIRTYVLDEGESTTVTFGELKTPAIDIERPAWASDMPLFSGAAA